MVPRLLLRPEKLYLGRRRHQRPRLHRALRLASSFLPHVSDALRHADIGQCVSMPDCLVKRGAAWLTPKRSFMESLDWVDRTYMTKHKSDDPKLLRAMYYPNLRLYQKHRSNPEAPKKKPMDAIIAFLMRSGTRALLSLGVYMASYLPYIGRLVLPAVSFWTFKKAVGTQPAAVIFAGGLFLPRHYLVTFLQSYFSSRSLMRQLVCLLYQQRTACD